MGVKIGPDWAASEAPKPLIGKGGLVRRGARWERKDQHSCLLTSVGVGIGSDTVQSEAP